jgi:2-C-methyl-D-erythritol 4-phosphate cytidylyltransferase
MDAKWFAIIVAGGSGTRMGSEIPKQFLPIGGLPILMHTLSLFNSFTPAPTIILVLPLGEFAQWDLLCEQYNFTCSYTRVAGGQTRFHSVQNGLNAIKEDGLVAIHDGVRPFVSKAVIENCLKTAAQWGCAIPAIQPHESIRKGSPESSTGINRSSIWLVQTPQVFDSKILRKIYRTEWNDSFTDDASVAEWNGLKILMVDGNPENIKITSPYDLIVGEAFLKSRKDC